ncbi:hypothetical protein [Sodalis sp.]
MNRSFISVIAGGFDNGSTGNPEAE